jgi:hypothetical protein
LSARGSLPSGGFSLFECCGTPLESQQPSLPLSSQREMQRQTERECDQPSTFGGGADTLGGDAETLWEAQCLRGRGVGSCGVVAQARGKRKGSWKAAQSPLEVAQAPLEVADHK